MGEQNATSGGKRGVHPQNKGGKRARAAIAGFDPFDYLVQRAIKAKSVQLKDRLALELLPYVKPKLKAVELSGNTNITVTVTIGGLDQ